VRQARAAGVKGELATISFVGTENLIADRGRDSEGVLISQVVPAPSDASQRLTREYQAALKKTAPTEAPSYVSFEGYVNDGCCWPHWKRPEPIPAGRNW
jgi:branched-chain amino acid transport system substrate-binding protein